MAREHPRHLRGRIGRGLLVSIFLHAQVLVPLVTYLFWWGKPGDDEVSVSFEAVKDDELPPDLPSIEKPAEPTRAKKTEKPMAMAKPKPVPLEPEPKPEPEKQALALVPPKPQEKPAEKPAEKPEQKPEEKPQPQERDLLHEKIVDLDLGKDVPEPKDAKYLAQRNNRTEHETRARDTNLDKAQQGKPAMPSGEEEKIAHLEDREEKLGHRGGQAPEQPTHELRSPLSMRTERASRQSEPLDESPDGLLAKVRQGRPGTDQRDRPAPEPSTSPHLTRKGYAAAFGDDAAEAAAVAKQEKSKHKSKFAERSEKVLAALENFINEVTPGNQTELNTRAAPFAQFITRMHRQIHEKWAFGFLNDMDTSLRQGPMDDMKLLTNLEIVLDGEGNVDRISMVRTSGNTGFDAAAISSVYAAGPFPTPPEAIRSGNGKVYLHWKFHRNGDACGTPGVSYFILDNGAKKQPRAGSAGPQPSRG